MQIVADVTLDDYQAFVRSAKRYGQSGTARRNLIVGGIAGAIVLLAFMLATDVRIHIPTVLLLAALTLSLYYIFSREYQARLSPTSGGCLLGQRTYSIDEEGVHVTSKHFDAHIRWGGVQSIQDVDDHVFLLMDTWVGYIIPKRSFTEAQSLKDLVDFVSDRIGSTGKPGDT